LNIKLAWDFDLECYKSLFPEITLFDWEKHRHDKIDLMVFPGGEDVSLEFYCSRSMIEEYKNMCHTNKERDDYEMSVLDACFDGRLNVNKILGVCRGMQFINVMFDGKLYPDLYSHGIGHDRIHDIFHKVHSNLGFLQTVNSLHHQGLSNVGNYDRRGNRSYPTIIATDKSGHVPEIVTWQNDRTLGIQFHPEYFWDDNPDKKAFREFCYDWVDGKTKILK
jgi:putative glutamine amidotransferase